MTNSKPREVEDIARKVPDYVTAESRGSVLIRTDFTRASFDQDALRTMQQSVVLDKPVVKNSALIGGRDTSATVVRRTKELLSARIAEFASSVVPAMPTVFPFSSPFSASTASTHRNIA